VNRPPSSLARRRPAATVLALLLALVLATTACSSSSPSGPDVAAGPGSTSAPGGAVSAVPGSSGPKVSSYPVTFTMGDAVVTLDEQPTRVVSLSPSITEMLFAIGAGPQVTAVDKSSDHPTGTPITDLSGFKPNVEAIAGYEPDLVVLARDRDGVADGLAALEIPTLVLTNPTTLEGVYAQIELLGRATGHEDEATALTRSMHGDIEAILADLGDDPTPITAYYELSDGLDTVGPDTFLGELLGLAGYENIADEAPDAAGGFPTLTNEFVVDADPAVIFVAHSDGTDVDTATIAGRPGWSGIQAVADGRVVALDTDLASRWGPRLVDLLRILVEERSAG
jgi:iron complex transport system substrate-binding protein